MRVGSEERGKGGEVIQVDEVINHPNFDSYLYDFDYALLKLVTPIEIDGISKAIIQLASESDLISDNTPVVVSGWGDTQNINESSKGLRAVIIPIMNQVKCDNIYYYDGGITSNMVCAGSSGKDSCSVSIFLYFC